MDPPHHSLLALSKKYGPIILMHLGYTPALIITSVEILAEMIKTHDIVFSNRPKTKAADILLYGSQDITFANYGENWRQARKNIITRCVLGQKSDKKDDGKKRFGDLSRRISTHVASVCYGDFFPYLGWIDVLTGLIPRMKETFKELDSFFDQVIEEHRILKNRDEDFVDILLQLQSDDLLGFDLTQDKLKGILMDMIIAGTETTSTTMEWIMAELVRNPTTLKKAQEEVRRVVGGKSEVEKSDIEQMGYLQCVIKEALRLHCPIPFMVPRETSASVKLGGYDIPHKTRVLVNVWAIQRDPQVWGDSAEEFIPERFGNNPIDYKGQDFEYLPFGVGRRGCPGTSFGFASVEYVIANLLCWFDWALPHGITPENLDMRDAYSISSPKKVPLYLVPALHSPSI